MAGSPIENEALQLRCAAVCSIQAVVLAQFSQREMVRVFRSCFFVSAVSTSCGAQDVRRDDYYSKPKLTQPGDDGAGWDELLQRRERAKLVFSTQAGGKAMPARDRFAPTYKRSGRYELCSRKKGGCGSKRPPFWTKRRAPAARKLPSLLTAALCLPLTYQTNS